MPFTKAGDRRVRRTRDALRRAMGKLLMDRDLQDITVKEIAEMANINRSTFYLHYEDIYDLYRRTEDDIVQRISALVAEQAGAGDMDVFTATIQNVIDYLYKNAELCAAVVRYNGAHLVKRLIEENRPQDEAGWKRLMGECTLPRDYCYTFITNGCVGVILYWLKFGAKDKPEYIAALARRMVMSVVAG